MTHRTCEAEGCDRPHAARGLCASHYGTWHRKQFGRKDLTYERTCVMCGGPWTTRRRSAKYCSDECKGTAYSRAMRRKCSLPPDHPVLLEIQRQRESARVSAAEQRRQRVVSLFLWRTARECRGCGCHFTPLYTPTMLDCSKRCQRRVARRRRRAAEVGASGSFIWSDFMRIAQRFDFCCAYCGTKPIGQLDPDHVVALSRGGANSTANLLPSCRACNADKRDLTLDEWSVDRERRGLPPRLTAWAPEDKRYHHLTHAILVGVRVA